MSQRFQQNQSTINRRIARRRFVALSSLAALAVLLLSTSVASQATSLVGSALRGADLVSDGPALAGNHVARRHRPASLARQRAVTHPAAAEAFPAGSPDGSAPSPTGPLATAVAPAAPSAPSAPAGSETPEAESPPAQEGPGSPPSEPTPPPKSEPEPPPKVEPEPEPEPEPAPPKVEPEPEPEPAPEPPKVEPNEPLPDPPATPTEEPLFEGSEIDDFETVEAAKGAITEVPDPLGSGETVIKMTVDDTDVYPVTPTENPRAQALSPDMIEDGDEFWLHTKFLLPQDFPSNIPGWVGLGSIYGEPFNGPSPWQLDVEGEHINWPRNSTYNWDVPWQMPILKGQWITVLLHERFAADGWVEMWVNGQPVTFFSSSSSYNPSKIAPTTHLEMKTMDKSNNGGPNAAKIANYRLEGMFKTLTVYFGALRVGETRESVEG